MTRYRDQVAATLRAVGIRGRSRYVWLGRISPPLPVDLEAEMDNAAKRSYLVSSLATELYASFYCRGRPVPVSRPLRPAPAAEDPRLAAALSDSNTGSGGWERGWTVERLEDGTAVVATSRVRARIPTADCDAPAGLRPGSDVSVRVPKELPSLSPGFYTAIGDAPANVGPSTGVRVYWHVTRTGAVELMRALTERLNAAQVPFRLKIADHSLRLLERCDASVLYLPVDGFVEQREMLLEVGAGLTAHLRPEIPAFTLELAPGVGLAEDLGGSESFGTRRCTLLAEGIVRAHGRRLTALRSRIGAVAERFAEDRVDIDAPYREPALSGRHVL